ncbi:MAG TPA: T9SS type A sorting domain-containing protein [Candidatus Marinimicrobia bacterium]|nr:T9SS type A sorting domain-containing protein [Candidatus Neomarinimicrobiota bacterium]
MFCYRLNKIRLLLRCLVLWAISSFLAAAVQISHLTIEGESDPRQCLNHAPVFIWQLSDSSRDMSSLLQIYFLNDDGDSLIWTSDTLPYPGNHFQFRSLGALLPGASYRFSIQIFSTQDSSQAEKSCFFTMNTPPTVPKIDSKTELAVTRTSLKLPVITATDRQISASEIAYQIQVATDSLLSEIILDTIFTGTATLQDRVTLWLPIALRDNSFGYYRIRSHDGVEFSDWSNLQIFLVNYQNDPPQKFDLLFPVHGDTLANQPLLAWQAAYDPDVQFGRDSLSYIVEYSTDSSFRYYTNKITVGGHQTEYPLESVINHETYYWRVYAVDREGAVQRSRQQGCFTLNTGNRFPAVPKILAPLDKQVLTPNQYILWQFVDDPDKADRLSFTLIILDHITKYLVYQEYISDSLVIASRFGLAEDFSIGYNNIAQYQLRRVDLKKLSDGHYYDVQIAVSDNWGGYVATAGEEAVFQYDDNINTAPGPPQTGFSPSGTIVKKLRPVFSWDPAIDKDVNDRLKYRVQISRDSTFSNTRYIIQESRYDQTHIRLRSTLLENTTYFWRVRAIDLEEAMSPWSPVNSFTVNQYNEAPGRAVPLVSPPDLTEIADSGLIQWLPVFDPDPGDSVSYLIEISERNSFYNPLIRSRLNLPPHPADFCPADTLAVRLLSIDAATTKLNDNQIYYWRVLAYDKFNVRGPAPDTPIRFIYNPINDPPFSVTHGFRPANGEIIKSRSPVLTWNAASDPDFSDLQFKLSYKIQISPDALFQESNCTEYRTDPGDTVCFISHPLEENQKYFYRIQTLDPHGAASNWSTINSFITNEIPEAPFPVTAGFIPKDSVIVDTHEPLVTWLPASDPDPGQYQRDLHYIVRYFLTTKPGKHFYAYTEKGVPSVQLGYLNEDVWYGYQVAAIDPDGMQSEWSKIHYFGVNAYPEFPAEFQLLSPKFYEDSVLTDATFRWQASRDYDLGDKVQYTFYYSTDSTFSANGFEAIIESADTVFVEFQPAVPLEREKKYFWKVVATDNSGNQTWGSNSAEYPFIFTTIGYRRINDQLPKQFMLYQNYPNPFNQLTKFKYVVSELGPVEVTIYDILGKRICTLANGQHQPGIYEVVWDGTDNSGVAVPGGMYLCHMQARNFNSHKKVLLMK